MNYVLWALVALVAYSFVAPLTKIASTEIPILIVALVANLTITVVNVVLVLQTNEFSLAYFSNSKALYMLGAGIFLTIGILAYFYALSIGPVSVVVPIFGMFIIGSSLIGFFLLNEFFTLQKLLGISLAVVGIFLTTYQ